MPKEQAEEAYEAAIKRAERAYLVTVNPKREAWRVAIIYGWAACDALTRPAMEAYDAARERAERAYQIAVGRAWVARNLALEQC